MRATRTNGIMGAAIALAFLMGTWRAPVACAQQPESIAVAVGAMEIVDLPFAIEGFRMANPKVARAEGAGDRRVRILGLEAGATDLQVTGAGGVSALYTINVLENIKAILAAMKRDLDTVPEVDLTVNLDKVVIKGEVSSLANWRLLQRVTEVYSQRVTNLAVFRPAPEVMLGLRGGLEKSGFRLSEEDQPAEAGVVSLRFTGNTIFVNGSVYSQRDVDRIKNLVRAQDWLVLQEEVTDDKQAGDRVRAILNVAIVPTMIELDAIFVGVSQQELDQIGVNLAKAGLITIDTTAAAFRGTVGKHDHGSYGGSYTINSGLQGALQFFKGSGPGRFRNAGHMVFRNDSPEWRMYQSGGTLKVRTATADRVGLEDIDYGLIMRVRGGLLDPQTASMDVHLELSYPISVGADYDLKRNRIETSVNCPLGQTMVMAGMRNLTEQTSREGIPFLRSIPIVQWLVSEKRNELVDAQVLILLSPQLAGATRPSLPVSEETASTLEEAEKTTRQRDKEIRRKKGFFRRFL
jgi:Flp pilus assembly secretin CpaC